MQYWISCGLYSLMREVLNLTNKYLVKLTSGDLHFLTGAAIPQLY
jgi:hypothetical protein